jgi:FkbM family methyltransferase
MMRYWLQRAARKYGYEIRKAPFPDFQSVSVFDLALHYLMATRGENLTFIEVGANDGRSSDLLCNLIEKHHWRGVLIEPQPAAFEKLKTHYAGMSDRLSFENVAISSDPNPLVLYGIPNSTSTLASANPKIVTQQSGVKLQDLVKMTVQTARLDDVVRKHGLSALDVLQLDTEGYDWDVLQTLDLSATRPWLIRFEHGHLPPMMIGKMTQYLNAHGYDMAYGGYEHDSVALRKDLTVPQT